MKILVCISNVPDTTTKIRFTEGNTSVDTSGVQWVINPWDELSLTRALELRDDPASGFKSVTVIHSGPASAEPTIRKALAIGADDAVRIDSSSGDAYSVAAGIAEVVSREQYDMILCGVESSDYNGSMVGGMLAEFLEIPSVSGISEINSEGGNVTITRETDEGKEIVSVPLPFTGIVQKGIAKEPRIAAMRGIMMARNKQIRVYESGPAEPLTEINVFEKPPARGTCKFIDAGNPEQLIDLLQNEAKVI
ncbi:MAG: electron transfer flavoprotein subunit beta/FixA family protein [Bacteroidales bacterium]|nr:electron transfer flavoprotein subunit beta/FixA family protein [Bacteroidales bacterium]